MKFEVDFNSIGQLIVERLVQEGKIELNDDTEAIFSIEQLKFNEDGLIPNESYISIRVFHKN